MKINLTVHTVNSYLVVYTNTFAYNYYVDKANSINKSNNDLNSCDLNENKIRENVRQMTKEIATSVVT